MMKTIETDEEFDRIEDNVCRVRWMSACAWDAIKELDRTASDDDRTKAMHLARAAKEEAERLYKVFYGRDA